MSLIDIRNCAERILRFADGHTFESFMEDEMRRFAIEHQFMIMGEAVKRLPNEFRASRDGIPWAKIASFRDQLIHRYDEIDYEIVWDVVQHNLETLLDEISPLIPDEPED